ncbi:pentatricopeptide repeat-containing protein At3g06430, chloroplastic [Magnolia sinica]|uniref:pentatricopeptide repeat-containing protein At3g06430, chloroplastic n=1 Tax=Magnolia sinica TaxID=86752 RepID=UPI002659BCC7|nr:pentatricopeptide repeat-containing protein At3g06430, chloroplastic [Magnolia sinica]
MSGCPFSFSSLSHPTIKRNEHFKIKTSFILCAFGSQLKRHAPSSPGPPGPKHVPPLTKKRHWKEGEFPGISETSLPHSPRSPIKNLKKKMDNKKAAKAWVSTVTETLAEKIEKKQWEDALEVFEMLREQPFYLPREGTYMKLLVLLGRSGQPYRAHKLFDTMVEEGCEPNAALYTALLAAYCRNNLLEDAFAVLNHMKTLPLCQPDVFTYSTLLKACVEASRFELVNTLFQEMADRQITPNTVTQNIVLGGYGKAGKFDKMEKVLSGMLESSMCKPDVWTMNIILGLFGNKGQIEAMEKWYEKFRSIGIEPETRTFNILISAYGKKHMYDKMTAVLEYMRKLAFPWTTSTYNNVIEAFADVGDAKHMEYAFDQMRAEGMKADTKTFCCVINGYSNARLFHKVVSSIQLAERLEIPANTSFYNAVISACAKAEDLMEMERVFTRMKDRHFQPDLTTFSIMIEAYAKEGMTDKIYDLEQEKQKMGGNG